jgi:hypothetical protein
MKENLKPTLEEVKEYSLKDAEDCRGISNNSMMYVYLKCTKRNTL